MEHMSGTPRAAAIFIAIALATGLASCEQEAVPPHSSAPPSPRGSQQASEAPVATDIDGAIAGSWRTPALVASDRFRNPRDVLEFLKIDAGSDVVLVGIDSAYYAELLAPLLRGRGALTILALPGSPVATRAEAGDPLLAGVDILPLSQAEHTPASADVVFVSGGVDRWVVDGTAEQTFKALGAMLRDGGVLGVVQARAKGAGLQDGTSGYLPEQQVIFLGELAGLELEEWSEMSANPSDTRDATTAGTLVEGGEPDRMTLRFVKRGSEQAG